jgi:hypothetical protein
VTSSPQVATTIKSKFKGVFMRYLTELADAAYRAFAQTQSDRIWNTGRDSLNRVGQHWSTNLIHQPERPRLAHPGQRPDAILAALPIPA